MSQLTSPPKAEFDPEGAESDRVAALSDLLLNRAEDEELQALVSRASQQTGYPIALVSLILNQTQYFRAHVGLPPELAIARATDRCSSFCQFVVSERRPFYVTHAERDERVPQDLVQRYGIQAYYGVPLTINGHVAGSLCVIDVRPRELSEEARSSLAVIAAAAERRLGDLTSPRAVAMRLMQLASHPSLAELRNQLQRVFLLAEKLPSTLTDLSAAAELAGEAGRPAAERRLSDAEIVRALGALAHVPAAIQDGMETVERLLDGAGKMLTAIRGLESLVRPEAIENGSDPVEAVLRAADLALHATKIVGGFHFDVPIESRRVAVSRSRLVAIIAATLNLIAGEVQRRANGAQQSRITASLSPLAPGIALHLTYSGLAAESWKRLRASAASLTESEHAIALEAHADALVFHLAFEPASPSAVSG